MTWSASPPLFPHANLRIDVLAVEIDEVRISRRRRPGYAVADRRLREVVTTVSLREAGDLWALLPGDWPERFTTRNLAERLGRPAAFAQRVAYCLRLAGAVDTFGKDERRRVYARTGSVLTDVACAYLAETLTDREPGDA